MSYTLIAGGYRPTFALLSFDPATAKLKTLSESKAPSNGSWIETAHPKFPNVFYAVSEEESAGTVVSLKKDGESLSITATRTAGDGPAHLHVMKDGSGIVVANYIGGTAVFFPLESDGSLSKTSSSPALELPFAYKDSPAPNPERQDKPHAHQVVEGKNGLLYIVDLGSDRIYVVEKQGVDELAVKGFLQAPEGAGPRHVVISKDGGHLYALTELHHSLLIFTLPSSPTYPLVNDSDFEANIIPPNVPKTHQKYMDSAELVLNPTFPQTLYASNRWELHIKEKNPDLPEIEHASTDGDAVAIVVLSADGQKIESLSHVRTGCDAIRGMSVSPDGKYVALAGQEGGGVEIWKVEGEKGQDWKLAAKEPSLEQIVDLVWL
ncbi:6-phosphogluconolactonase, partial [Tremellales sp. Uapishka_1]